MRSVLSKFMGGGRMATTAHLPAKFPCFMEDMGQFKANLCSAGFVDGKHFFSNKEVGFFFHSEQV